jgi:cytidine deaminase
MSVDDATVERLVRLAREASTRAHCPYSHFRVGAVVLTDAGETYTGCNVENASYGLTMCAERNAIFGAIARAGRRPVVRMVVIYTPTSTPTAPCGACRQIIHEFGADAEVVSACDGEARRRTAIATLLPDAFGQEDLDRAEWPAGRAEGKRGAGE